MKRLFLIPLLALSGCGDDIPSLLGTWRLDLESSATCIIEITGQDGSLFNWDLSRTDPKVYGKTIDCPDSNGEKLSGKLYVEERGFHLGTEGPLFNAWSGFTGKIAEGNRYMSGKLESGDGNFFGQQVTSQTFTGHRIVDGNP